LGDNSLLRILIRFRPRILRRLLRRDLCISHRVGCGGRRTLPPDLELRLVDVTSLWVGAGSCGAGGAGPEIVLEEVLCPGGFAVGPGGLEPPGEVEPAGSVAVVLGAGGGILEQAWVVGVDVELAQLVCQERGWPGADATRCDRRQPLALH